MKSVLLVLPTIDPNIYSFIKQTFIESLLYICYRAGLCGREMKKTGKKKKILALLDEEEKNPCSHVIYQLSTNKWAASTQKPSTGDVMSKSSRIKLVMFRSPTS